MKNLNSVSAAVLVITVIASLVGATGQAWAQLVVEPNPVEGGVEELGATVAYRLNFFAGNQDVRIDSWQITRGPNEVSFDPNPNGNQFSPGGGGREISLIWEPRGNADQRDINVRFSTTRGDYNLRFIANAVEDLHADIDVQPMEIRFPDTQVSELSEERIVTIRNRGNEPLEIDDLFLDGQDDDEFELLNRREDFQIAVGGSFELRVRFVPRWAGERQSRIYISSNDRDEDENPLWVRLSGIGTNPPRPRIIISDMVLDFGRYFTDEEGELRLAIHNEGQAELVGSIAIEAPDCFHIHQGGGDFRIAANGEREVFVRFAPQEAGMFNGRLVITHNGFEQLSPAYVTLRGEGRIRGVAELVFDVAEHDFGDCVVGERNPNPQRFTLTNHDQNHAFQGRMFITPPDAASFILEDEDDGAYNLEPGESDAVDIYFAPQRAGDLEAVLMIRDENWSHVHLTGHGVEREERLSFNHAQLNFQAMVGHDSEVQTVMVTNNGNVGLNIVTNVVGNNANLFCGGNQNFRLEPDGSRELTIIFHPVTAGEFQATLQTNLENGPAVTLIGHAEAEPQPNIVVNPAAYDFGDVEIGSQEELVVEVTNDGQAALRLTNLSLFNTNGQIIFTNGGGNIEVTLQPEDEPYGISITCQPNQEGVIEADLVIESDDPSVDDQGRHWTHIPLTANGLPAEQDEPLVIRIDNLEARAIWAEVDQHTFRSNQVDFRLTGTEDYTFSLNGQEVTVDEEAHTIQVTAEGTATLIALVNPPFLYLWDDPTITFIPADGLVIIEGQFQVGDFVTLGGRARASFSFRSLGLAAHGDLTIDSQPWDPIAEVDLMSVLNTGYLSLRVRAGLTLNLWDVARLVFVEGSGGLTINVPNRTLTVELHHDIATLEFVDDDRVAISANPLQVSGAELEFNLRTWRCTLMDDCEITAGLEGLIDVGVVLHERTYWDMFIPHEPNFMSGNASAIIDIAGQRYQFVRATVGMNWPDNMEFSIEGLQVGDYFTAADMHLLLNFNDASFTGNARFNPQGNVWLPVIEGDLTLARIGQQNASATISGVAHMPGFDMSGEYVINNDGVVASGRADITGFLFDQRVDFGIWFGAMLHPQDQVYQGRITTDLDFGGQIIRTGSEIYIHQDFLDIPYDLLGLRLHLYVHYQHQQLVGRDDPQEGEVSFCYDEGLSLTVDRPCRLTFQRVDDEEQCFIMEPDGWFTGNIDNVVASVNRDDWRDSLRYPIVHFFDPEVGYQLTLESATNVPLTVTWSSVDYEEGIGRLDQYRDLHLAAGQTATLLLTSQANPVMAVQDEEIEADVSNFLPINTSQIAIYGIRTHWVRDNFLAVGWQSNVPSEGRVLFGTNPRQLDHTEADNELTVNHNIEIAVQPNSFCRIRSTTAESDSVDSQTWQINRPQERRGVSQLIPLVPGWNLISSYVEPSEPDMVTVCAPLVQELQLVKNGAGRFYAPSFGFNNIGDWRVNEAYQIKAIVACAMVIYGQAEPADRPIQLPLGWSMVAYFPEERVAAPDAFSNIADHILLVKDGWGRFWNPEFGFCNMDLLQRGWGYQVKLSEAAELVWNVPEGQVQGQRNNWIPLVHFATHKPTGANMSILLIGLPKHAEVAVFDPSGCLIGSGVVNDQGMCGIAVWADDQTTDEIDGAKEGEKLSFCWFDGEKEENLDLKPFVNFAIDELAVVRLSGQTMSIPSEYGLSAHPNPFNATTVINFDLPESQNVSLTVYDLNGRKIVQLTNGYVAAGSHTVVFDGTEMMSGMYLARLQSEQCSRTIKLLLIK